MKRLLVLACLVCLAACCPPALQAQPTAFRAEVLGTTTAGSLLQLRRDPGSPLLSVAVATATLSDADGAPLTLEAFQPGDSVYLTGMMRADEVQATQIQRLN